ncbi:MAG: sulfatase-like hydrolase/transferase [Candidatus Polarisedimenticolia bacterium]
MRLTRGWLLAGAAVLALAVALVIWMRAGGAYRGATGDASLLLITVDGLRCDRVGACGGPEGLTPVLDRLAAKGVSFQQAFTASVASRPSHASLLTARWPFDHGVRDRDADRLPARIETLAGTLARHGFRTAAIVSSEDLSGLSGLDQGFELYDDALPGRLRPPSAVTDAAIERLRRSGAERAFLWVHYAAPAFPLAPPEPFRSLHAAAPYDGIVAHVDAEISRLLESLQLSGRGARTLVVVAGSHGYSLGAHGEMLSGSTLHDETVRVPLLFVLEPYIPAGVRVTGVVRTVDIVPTVLELLRIGTGAREPGPGVSLWPWMSGRDPEEPPPAYAEAMDGPSHGWSAAAALREGRYVLIRSAGVRLYDTAADPNQLADLAASRADLTARLRSRLEALAGQALPPADGLPDVEQQPRVLHQVERARMALLAGQNEIAAREARGALEARPSDHRLRLVLAGASKGSGRDVEAVAEYEAVLAALPAHRAALAGLVAALERSGNAAGLAAACRRGLELDPDDPRWLSGLGRAALMTGDRAEAARRLTAALRSRPDHLPAILTMASLLEAGGKMEEAAAFYARATEVVPVDANVWMAWGWSLFQLQRNAAALEALMRARDLAPGAAPVDVALGDVYLAMGRRDEARDAYRRALRADAGTAQALYGIGVLDLGDGQAPGAVEMLEKALALRPGQAAWREDYARALAAAGKFSAAADQMDMYLTSGRVPADRRDSLRQEATAWRRRR